MSCAVIALANATSKTRELITVVQKMLTQIPRPGDPATALDISIKLLKNINHTHLHHIVVPQPTLRTSHR